MEIFSLLLDIHGKMGWGYKDEKYICYNPLSARTYKSKFRVT